jgi:hypothetical protein
MGTDLHMNPPTPDEYRIVRCGDYTAVYYRHTDAIYKGGTNTWYRKTCHPDPHGVILNALRESSHYRVTTLPEHKHYDGLTLPLEASLDYIGEPDMDYDGEEKRLRAAYEYALRDLTRARETVGRREEELDRFLALREEAGK